MSKFSRVMAAIVSVILYFTLIASVGAFVAIPWLAKYQLSFYFREYVPTLIFLYVGGLCVIWLVIQFILIMKSVQQGSPFIYRNVKSLAHIAGCCAVCAVDMVYIQFFTESLTLLICGAILVFGCLCAIVLASVFRQAVLYKQENDLTI